MKQILYIDMDGVLVDLGKQIREWFIRYPHLREKYEAFPDHIPGIFRDPVPIPNAVDAVHALYDSGRYDMFIATTVPWGNPYASTDKRFWIENWFGDMFHKRLIITSRKDLLVGDYLIDDRVKNGAGEFGSIANRGELIYFGSEKFPNWKSVTDYLL